MRLPSSALSKHLYVIGATGSGKSRALESWIVQLIKDRQGVGVIDPAGELYDNLLARIALHGRRLYERVVLFDPTDSQYSVSFNPLELREGEVAERRADFLSTVVTKIFGGDETIMVRMKQILYHTFWLLIRSELTLLDFVRVVTEREYRTGLVEQLPLSDPLRRFWEKEFPAQPHLIAEWTSSSLSRVKPLISDPDLALILGAKQSSIDFRAIMDEGKVLLVKLPKGIIGESKVHLMAAFIVAQIQLAAFSRAEEKYSPYRPFTLFLDEFQDYVTDDVHQVLAQSRKYGLSLVMAHQYLKQLEEKNPVLLAAVLNTVHNLVAFQVGHDDGERLVKEFFAADPHLVKDVRVRKLPTGISWYPFTTERDSVYYPLEEVWEQYIQFMSSLPPRYFWYKRRGSEAALQQSLTMPDIVFSDRLAIAIDTLRGVSATQYGYSKLELQNGLRANVEGKLTIDDIPADFEPLV